MCRAGVRRLGHTFCWCSLILSLPLRDDTIAASVRSLMGRRCRPQPVLHLIDVHVKLFFWSTVRGQQCVELVVDVIVNFSVGVV